MKTGGEHHMADQIDSRAALWASVRALMLKEFGEENSTNSTPAPKSPWPPLGASRPKRPASAWK